MLREGWVRLLVLGAAAFVMLVGASDPLRPLVMRTEQPRGAVPAECEEGLSPTPAIRVDVREIPLPEEIAPPPATVAAPPQGELRGALESVQNALVRNNRPEFDEALVRTRLIVERYPTGGERRAAEELIRIYEGAGRLWEAQYQSPFFAQESAEYAAVAAYPEYQEAVRRSTLTDAAGRKFYPAAESREFLTRVAADRLKRLGVRVTTPPARVPRADVSAPAASPTPNRSSVSAPASPRSSTASTSRRPATTTTRSTTSRATTSRTTTSRPTTSRATTSPSTATTRKPAATTSAPSTPNPSAPPTVAAVPAPAAPSAAPPAAGDPDPDRAVTSDPVAADTDPPAAAGTAGDTAGDTNLDTAAGTGTTTAAAPITPPPAAPEAAKPARGRSVILPTILILIGLGVLIVLFRASK